MGVWEGVVRMDFLLLYVCMEQSVSRKERNKLIFGAGEAGP